MSPKRIQMSRQKPWRADNQDAVIVARPSKWGNPFAVGRTTEVHRFPSLTSVPVLRGYVTPRDRAEAVRLFAYMLREDPPFDTMLLISHSALDGIHAELAGKDLACWCPLDQPCHADVLLELANPKEPVS